MDESVQIPGEKTLDEMQKELSELITENPFEFMMAVRRLATQISFDVFAAWEGYRAELHNRRIGPKVLIKAPIRPEDTERLKKINALMGKMTQKAVQDEKEKEYDEILQKAKQEKPN